MSATNNNGPLADIRVIEVGQLLAGPFCGQLLGDFGADVIKVEQPGDGDPMREWGREKVHGKSLWWPLIGRNKRSITCNLRVTEGQEILRELVREADILIENFRPGTLEKWNLGWEELKRINPRLIFVRVSGFGQTGPYSSRAGYGSIGEAMGGLRYVSGDPSAPPSRVGIAIGDSLAAMHAAFGAVMAVYAREKTGRGQVIDSAIYESVLNVMESLVTEYDQAGYIRERSGPILPNIAPSNAYPSMNGLSVMIGANQDTVFRRLCQAMGRPELADDERYATHTARGAHQKELDSLIAEWTSTFDSDTLLGLMEQHGVPAGGIYRAPEMMEDPHFKAREAIIRVPHREFGTIAMQNVAPRLSETPGSVRHCGPDLGEHTNEILKEYLAYDAARIDALREGGVI